MPTLNLDLGYFSNIKTKRLEAILGKGAAELPIRLWCHCGLHHAEDGILRGYSVKELESLIGWQGVLGEAVAALVKVGFIEHKDGDFIVHEWCDHEGHIAAFHKRAIRANRKRWKKISRTPTRTPKTQFSDPPTIPNLPNQTIPNLPYQDAWDEWVSYRKEKKKPLTESQRRKQIKWLSTQPDPGACIEQSIRNGWQGLFEVKDGTNRQSSTGGRKIFTTADNLSLAAKADQIRGVGGNKP